MNDDNKPKKDGCNGCSSSSDCFADMALKKKGSRRGALAALLGGAATAAASTAAAAVDTSEEKELKRIKRDEFFQKYYRVMTEEERAKTLARFERKSKLEYGVDVKIDHGRERVAVDRAVPPERRTDGRKRPGQRFTNFVV